MPHPTPAAPIRPAQATPERDRPVPGAPSRLASRPPLLRGRTVGILVAVLTAAAPSPLAAQVASSDQETWDVRTPRGEAFTIRFTTDEGTWLSTDVSPDGRWVAIDLLGEIWLVPMAGGEARPLTREESGLAVQMNPAFSPDGSKLAFVSDRDGQDNIWTLDLESGAWHQVSSQRMKRMAHPTWTPDGDFIVARLGGDSNLDGRGEIWMWHVDGGEGVRLTGEDRNASWPSVSPDGRYVYFDETVLGGLSGNDPERGLYQLRRVDLESGEVREVTSGVGPVRDGGGGRRSSGGAAAPVVSPDGRYVAFVRRLATGNYTIRGIEYGPRTALWIRDLETGRERIVMDPITPDAQERNNAGPVPRYAWTPDGGAIVITEGGKLRRVDVASGRVETIPFTAEVEETVSGQVHQMIEVEEGPVEVRMTRWQGASPDGATLAFQGVGKVWLKTLPDGEPRRLTDAPLEALEFAPAWSPDGRSVAYVTWDDAEGGHVWTAPASGGTPRRVTELPGVYQNPTWSPDGSTLVVARGSGEMLRGRLPSDEAWYDLVALPAGGGEARLITTVSNQGRGRVVAPRFGPEDRVFYAEGGTLRSIRLDGLDRRDHAVIEAADQAAPSPDGRWVAFTRGDDVHLAPLGWPGVGGEPVRLTVDGSPFAVRELTVEGGGYPRWVDGGTLEFGAADRYYRHDVASGATDTVAIGLTVPRHRSGGTLAFTGARILTMDDDGTVIEEGDLVVRDGRIAAVGPSGSVDVPADARRIDASGKTLAPGFIDMHQHMGREAQGIHPQRSWEMAANLAYGVTSAMDPAASSEVIFTMAENVEAGVQVGPRIYSTGYTLSGGTSTRHGEVKTPDDARHEVNRLKHQGARQIKQYWQPRRDQRQMVVEASREAGLTVSAEGDTDAFSTVGFVNDGHTAFEHPILHVPLYRDLTEYMGRAGTFYSPTLVVGGIGPWGEEFFYQERPIHQDEKLRRFTPWRWLEPHTRRHAWRPPTDYPFPLHALGVGDVIDAGGYGTIGAHGQQQGYASHFEIWMMAAGMDNMTALRTATTHPARMIGISEDVGSLEAGKIADVVVLNADPLEDIRATADIRWVMKAGTLYDADTLDEVWPRERPFGDFYWRVEGIRGR